MSSMNTLNTIINSINQNINESVIDDLSKLGFSHKEATKLVVENNFSLVDDATANPVDQF